MKSAPPFCPSSLSSGDYAILVVFFCLGVVGCVGSVRVLRTFFRPEDPWSKTLPWPQRLLVGVGGFATGAAGIAITTWIAVMCRR